MNSQEIIEKIRSLANDPLGKIMTCAFPTNSGVIRWHCGFVQVRRSGDTNFSLGMMPEEFFRLIEVVPSW